MTGRFRGADNDFCENIVVKKRSRMWAASDCAAGHPYGSCRLKSKVGTLQRPLSCLTHEKRNRSMTPAQDEILKELQAYARTAATAEALMSYIAKRLHEKLTRYNWVGFYVVDPGDAAYLVVGPYAGSFTPNVRIPLNTGLCGAAASSRQVVVVQDVSKDPRYLAGSSMVKSEIVVPIFANKKLAAELDIESYFADSFPKSECEFVEACAGVVASYLAKA